MNSINMLPCLGLWIVLPKYSSGVLLIWLQRQCFLYKCKIHNQVILPMWTTYIKLANYEPHNPFTARFMNEAIWTQEETALLSLDSTSLTTLLVRSLITSEKGYFSTEFPAVKRPLHGQHVNSHMLKPHMSSARGPKLDWPVIQPAILPWEYNAVGWHARFFLD